jgi:hypothetical protein
LYFKQPTILVTPNAPQYARNAKIVEAVDKWLIPHIGLKQQLKLGIIDAFLTNMAVFKVGYHSVGTELPKEGTNLAAPSGAMSAIAELLGPAMSSEELGEEDEDLRKYSYHDWVKPNSPWVLRCQPEDFVVPYGCTDFYGAPWCAFRVRRPLEDFQSDPVYSHTRDLRENVTWDMDSSPLKSPSLVKQGEVRDQIPMVEGWEVWDKRERRIRFVVEEHEKFLRDDKHNLSIDAPAEILQFNSVGWDFWGESDAHQIHQQVIEYNETRTLEMMHKRSAILKFLYDKNLIDRGEITKMMNGEVCAVGVNGDPRQLILPLAANMSSDLFKVSEVIRDDVREVLGFSRNQAGDFDVSRRTATEAHIVQQALQLRSDERRDQVADLLERLFRGKIHPIIFDQWTERRIIEVTSLGGWTPYSGPEIRGDYTLSVIPDSVVPLTRMQRQKVATNTFQMFRGDPRIDQQRLYSWAISQFDDIMPQDLLVDEKKYQMQILMQAIQSGQLGQGGGQPKPGSNRQTQQGGRNSGGNNNAKTRSRV